MSSTIVISQVYGGGGNTGATFTHDFIELFNQGPAIVNLSGCPMNADNLTGTVGSDTINGRGGNDRITGRAGDDHLNGGYGSDRLFLRSRGDLEALPIDDARLDAATLMLVLHHVPDPGAVLQEAARTLKPRGRSHTRRPRLRSRWRRSPSSSTTSCGSTASARAIAMRCRCPPENSWG